MLQTEGLACVRNGRQLFEGLNIQLQAGELLRIEGGNGTGKTTLLRILCGLYSEYEGEVHWELDHYPAYVGHRSGVHEALTPVENLRWHGALHGEDISDAEISEALSALGLGRHETGMPCGHLSEGQRKRVGLARLLLRPNSAWILDEPFSAIDVEGVDDLIGMIGAQLDRGGVAILTSHQEIALTAPVKSIRLRGTE